LNDRSEKGFEKVEKAREASVRRVMNGQPCMNGQRLSALKPDCIQAVSRFKT
jgi:hypothetical protein